MGGAETGRRGTGGSQELRDSGRDRDGGGRDSRRVKGALERERTWWGRDTPRRRGPAIVPLLPAVPLPTVQLPMTRPLLIIHPLAMDSPPTTQRSSELRTETRVSTCRPGRGGRGTLTDKNGGPYDCATRETPTKIHSYKVTHRHVHDTETPHSKVPRYTVPPSRNPNMSEKNLVLQSPIHRDQ